MRRLYLEKSAAREELKRINAAQNKKNLFVNVSVKPYHGKKYDPGKTVVVCIG